MRREMGRKVSNKREAMERMGAEGEKIGGKGKREVRGERKREMQCS
jgi:hypothetical protein